MIYLMSNVNCLNIIKEIIFINLHVMNRRKNLFRGKHCQLGNRKLSFKRLPIYMNGHII